MDYRLLGPVEVRGPRGCVEIRGVKQRMLLVTLLVNANKPVSRDVLIDELWTGRPDGGQHSLEVCVSRLRKALREGGDGQVLVTLPGAYLLRVAEGELDVNRLEHLADEGRRALACGDPELAAAKLRDALALWHGQPLADVAYEHFAQAEISRLVELRIGAIEDRIDADLEIGRHRAVVGELTALTEAHPLRERLHGQLMTALYRCGRQAEALTVFRSARQRLIDELGLEPGQELRELERAILAQDPGIGPPRHNGGTPRPSRPARLRQRRSLTLASTGSALLLVAALLVAAVVAKPWRGGSPQLLPANSIGAVGPHGLAGAAVRTVGTPGGIASGAGAVWATDSGGDDVLKINPAGGEAQRIYVGRGPAGVAVADGLVWVVNGEDRTVSEVNPASLRQVATVAVGNGASAIAAGAGALWVANEIDDSVSRIDPSSGIVTATIPLAFPPTQIAATPGAIWVTSEPTGELMLIDPAQDRAIQSVPVGNAPVGVAVGAGSVWIANASERTVSRFDPATGSIHKIAIGYAPSGVGYGNGAVWVTTGAAGTLIRIDPATQAMRVFHVGSEPTAVTVADGRTWVTALPSPQAHTGGTLRLISATNPFDLGRATLDPAIVWDLSMWQVMTETNDGLVGYRRVPGADGTRLVPDLATVIPAPTNQGLTYTFSVRRSIHYSDGTPVKATDFRRAIERAFTVTTAQDVRGGPAGTYLGIVGASACAEHPRTCDLSRGIVADDTSSTVTFHLTAPDPEFLYKLALPFAYAVPSGTAWQDTGSRPIPATGPYMTKSFGQKRWVLVRNPRFHQWSQDAQPDGYPDRIIWTIAPSADSAVNAIESGRADIMTDQSIPPDRLHELLTRYAGRVHSDPSGAVVALLLNTRRPPFNHLDARRALNLALNRRTFVELAGGPSQAEPTCQVIPPNMLGYAPYCPYTAGPGRAGVWSAPDIGQAQRLVRDSGTEGMRVDVAFAPGNADGPASSRVARAAAAVLRTLGYRVSIDVRADPFRHFSLLHDVAEFSWYQDYPSPSDFINTLLSCGAYGPHGPPPWNLTGFCSRRIDAGIQAARALEASAPSRANRIWSHLDKEIVNQAPWAPLFTLRKLTIVSSRVGNLQFHPVWTTLLDQLWVR